MYNRFTYYHHLNNLIWVYLQALTAAMLSTFEKGTHLHSVDKLTKSVFWGFYSGAATGLSLIAPFFALLLCMLLEQDFANSEKAREPLTPGKHRVQMFLSNGVAILAFVIMAFCLRY